MTRTALECNLAMTQGATMSDISSGAIDVLQRGVRYLLCLVASALLTTAVLAHSSLTRSTPANGSVLDASPATIELTFRGAVRLTSVVVVKPDQSQLPLAFTPQGSADSFSVKQPQLAHGRNEIQWKALSKDGHVIGGTLLFTVK